PTWDDTKEVIDPLSALSLVPVPSLFDEFAAPVSRCTRWRVPLWFGACLLAMTLAAPALAQHYAPGYYEQAAPVYQQQQPVYRHQEAVVAEPAWGMATDLPAGASAEWTHDPAYGACPPLVTEG